MEAPITADAIFEVRNDKTDGILVLSIQCALKKIPHFFREHHQPIRQHPEQVQEIVKKNRPSVGHKKKIQIDVAEFLELYFVGDQFEFKGVLLRSATMQVDEVYQRKLNRQIGAAKRLKTMNETKQRKIEEKNARILSDRQVAEQKFQEERAKRLAELYGLPDDDDQQHTGNQKHQVDHRAPDEVCDNEMK